MQDIPNCELLRRFVQSESEEAFGELVRRHVNLVYSVALRHTENAHDAQEITQAVFIILARKAASLGHKTVLSGWLYHTARLTAANFRRAEIRHVRREQEAYVQSTLEESSPDALWRELAPLLDEAMANLDATDRDAVVLRYFEKQDLCAVGGALGISEDAAQKRVSRAVERLREFFAKRGVTIGASGLAVAMTANAVQAAPVGLAVTISATATLAETTLATTATVTATKAIAMTTLQKAIIGATLAAAIGTGIYEARQASRAREENRLLQQQQAPLAQQLQRLQHERDDATNRLASLADELAKTKSNTIELLKLRGEVARLRGSTPPRSNDPIDEAMKTWLVRVTKLKQRVAETPKAKIPEFRFLSEDDYMEATRSVLATEDDYLRALANLRSTGEFKFITSMLNPALTQYAQANNGQFPTDIVQLKPYFPSPVEDAILERWEIAPANTVKTDDFGDPIITQKTAVDEDFDPRYAVGLKGYASGGVDTAGHNAWGVVSPDVIMRMAAKAYSAANNGQEPTDPSQILPYLTTPEQQAALQKLLKWKQIK